MFVLSSKEATLLRLIGEQGGSSPRQLAAAAKLGPSELNATIAELVKKQLAEPLEETSFIDPGEIKLTEQGRSIRRQLQPPRTGKSLRDWARTVVVLDEGAEGASAEEVIPESEPVEPQDIDAELNNAIEKMRAHHNL